jgi:hypothetical protein
MFILGSKNDNKLNFIAVPTCTYLKIKTAVSELVGGTGTQARTELSALPMYSELTIIRVLRTKEFGV